MLNAYFLMIASGAGNNGNGSTFNYFYSQPQAESSNGSISGDVLHSIGNSNINVNTIKPLDKLLQVRLLSPS